MSGLLADGIGLSLVLGHSGVDLLNDIRADRAQEDGRVGVSRTGGSAIGADDRDGRSGSHYSPGFVSRYRGLMSATDSIGLRCFRDSSTHLGVLWASDKFRGLGGCENVKFAANSDFGILASNFLAGEFSWGSLTLRPTHFSLTTFG